MQSSIFNLRVPLPERDEVFLMNTLTDAQLIVSQDVAAFLDRVTAPSGGTPVFSDEERHALDLLCENGFIVKDRATERRTLDDYFTHVKASEYELNVTILTTLQCNFACDYCYQGDHGDYNKFAEKMSIETAGQVAEWIEAEMDRLHPKELAVTFFGGEPLLNLPVLYYLAERLWKESQKRDVTIGVKIITNGLLLTEEIVDRLQPWGLTGVKITLDGDRDSHNKMRPLRGGQGTFDRIIENIRKVAGKCRIAIGGNFDEASVDSYPALLEFLASQDFADQLTKVNFKPIIRASEPAKPKGFLPLIPVGDNGKPLGGSCMTAAGSGTASTCDSCAFLDDKLAYLREETKRHGFRTSDGVHTGPCHVHMSHAHTIGPDGSLYACPGFTGEKAMATGHIDGRRDPLRISTKEKFDRLAPWDDCGDCAFIPVCAGGCVTASHTTLGDMNKPTCHKSSMESALISLAHTAASAA
jgi:uncharacterized protein